ncbi:hypothetical protein [Chitinasiproducens palmae]|uniref:Group 4 capsule polysaccharide lipoprotein gfcB, YjbF n=1 Tax=Chitinasiproducens palmae TaxID=1770053 RepID=A0A1H2PPA8_9BURK|nr:hypothetical protein [Chitinasiproducens palmae]SDV48591.1 Group 4 capsule polysaccharide lipoprotein gfcB, YjbF [Chitinasiproducens palmae]
MYRLFTLLALVLLTACTTPIQAIQDAYTFKQQSKPAVVSQRAIDPHYQYLLMTIKGRALLLARGHIDPGMQGSVEVFFTAGGEVLRLLDGRVAGTAGMPVEWSSVVYSPLPDWRQVEEPVTLERSRDVMPGYQFGLHDQLHLQPIAPPRSTEFIGQIPSDTRWFEETATGSDALPTARYAVVVAPGRPAVAIYGEQCLSRDFCFTWQRWPNKVQE